MCVSGRERERERERKVLAADNRSRLQVEFAKRCFQPPADSSAKRTEIRLVKNGSLRRVGEEEEDENADDLLVVSQ